LSELGHQPLVLPCDLNLSVIKQKIETAEPDIVFNLVEALDDHGRLIGVVPGLFDALSIPYTGAPSGAIHETSHKILSKERMRAADLATPAWIGPWPTESCTKLALPDGIVWDQDPWIIKSVWEHASLGIGGDALVLSDSPEDLMDVLRQRAPELGGACFAERYIDGREFNLSIIAGPNGSDGPDGPVVLPPAEIVFENFTDNRPRIVCYKAKWDEASFEYTHTKRRFDFPDTDTALLDTLRETARRCWHVFGLRGYARVDFRVDSLNRPWILEVNANPCLSKDAGFSAAVGRSGMTFTQAVERILADAMNREMDTMRRKQRLFAAKPALTLQSSRSGVVTQKQKPSDAVFRYAPRPQDIRDIRELVDATDFFHSYEVDVAVELVEDRLAKGAASDYFFVFLEIRGRVVGYACYGPIPCTAHSFDLYWIAVHPDFQQQGFGRIISDETERLIQAAGGTRVYIETSQSDTYQTTRLFYRGCGYQFASILENFYAPGDGKVILCKTLTG
ncbi:MAG: GNAT family N-acetyltransferase, partial [Desulfosalsimonadaceae bacterium]|nr:GNAT family N-acetyltransferase [Desulfosalsimonadaceae bacterium]